MKKRIRSAFFTLQGNKCREENSKLTVVSLLSRVETGNFNGDQYISDILVVNRKHS